MISNILQLKLPDWTKALMMAITVPVVGYIITIIQSGSFMVSWHQIGLLAASGALGYILKQLGTSQTLTSIPPIPVTVTEKTFGITVQKDTTIPTSIPEVPPVIPSEG